MPAIEHQTDEVEIKPECALPESLAGFVRVKARQ